MSQSPAALRALDGEVLLAAWEAGAAVPEILRPLALLSAASPGTPPAALGAMPVAARDLCLLQLRELTFGPELAVFATCPHCGERMEFTLRARDLASGLAAAARAGPVEWDEDGRHYRLRPVTTDDLAAVLAAVPSVPSAPGAAAEDLLLARCTAIADEAVLAGGPGPAEETVSAEETLPTRRPASAEVPVPASAARRFEELHAEAELRCALDCPACCARQVHDLDIARFLWREVTVAARRLLAEVHTLGAAYGWPEQEIIRLSPYRRASYLELVGAGGTA